LETLEIVVFPMFSLENEIEQPVIDRLVNLCNKYHIDHTIFTETGGRIQVTRNLLQMAAYFASDVGLEPQDCIWGEIKPIKHIDHDLLEFEDVPQRIKNKVEGRKRGRPKKEKSSIPCE
jgi:hypothetical protein